jgi:L-aminopeptidase/D-esterase-like protein
VLLAALSSASQQSSDIPYRAGKNDALTDVPGVKVGHYTHTQGTYRGTTAVLFGQYGAMCAADVRGSNPVTMVTDTFAPKNIGEECDAVVLTGGSAFGLAAVSGVVDYLFEHGQGVETRAGKVPIVPAAVIFDLPIGDPKIHPQPSWGYKAAENAKDGPVAQGNVGAGAGGTMGKNPGGIRMKGGLGTASFELPGGVVVAALVVLNSLGDAVNPQTGEFYAVAGGFDRTLYRPVYAPRAPASAGASPLENTTLVVVATNAKLNKTQLTKVAELAHNGLARSIRPIHTMLDGDTVFAVSVAWAQRKALSVSFPGEEVDIVGGAAADVVVRAVLNGVRAAESIPGWLSYNDWLKNRPQRKKEASK